MYNSNRKSGYDWIIIGIYISLLIIGWFAIYAATYSYNVEVDFLDASVPITKQSIYVVVAVSVFLSSLYINSKFWHTFAYIFYGIGIFLLFFSLSVFFYCFWFSYLGVKLKEQKHGLCLVVFHSNRLKSQNLERH